MTAHAIRLHRVLRAAPEKLYRACLDAAAMAKWLLPYGSTCSMDKMDVRVGGRFQRASTNSSTGNGHTFGGKYRELIPNERIRHSDVFDDPNLPGELETTIYSNKVSCGSDLAITQTGIPEMIPV
ncbi:SRPBCC domain-containing protein [Dokdonella sp.]|uniref:SRPBCC domain-containing protein n=1 Tax=Dokdonella sp. TaxID=2291710 RepID=UPI003526E637